MDYSLGDVSLGTNRRKIVNRLDYSVALLFTGEILLGDYSLVISTISTRQRS